MGQRHDPDRYPLPVELHRYPLAVAELLVLSPSHDLKVSGDGPAALEEGTIEETVYRDRSGGTAPSTSGEATRRVISRSHALPEATASTGSP